ncbi:LysR family transcriptional regulator [Pseudohoeflea suaedae]|uniref:LysR family transcriptional regulator n=1 Tax=Pseudohoeflea suaedae TaxID=877384 RepID=A0A4R5PQ33_9HYPH|nr:LysR family transcriptional regulator [Pseudohoeflea suaedae]TDH39206.1 LysR family transcriptional regulator [Pseudohoeflea suaedae]
MANNPFQPSLDDLSVFLAVATSGGFRTAARHLGRSPSTVSDAISRLEGKLEVPLFARTTRSVRLTEAGQALAARLDPLIAEARAALDEAASSRSRVRGRLKLNAPGAVMVDILPPLVASFVERHPDVQVEIVVDDRFVDIVAAGCDAGIRYGEHLAQDMIAVPIGPRRQHAALAASPDYIERFGAPSHPQELLGHHCIGGRFASGALTRWEFEKNGETLIVDPPSRVIVSLAGPLALVDLALQGAGLVQTFGNWLEPHFASGQLVPVMKDWWDEFDGPKLYFSSRLTATPLRAFIDHVAASR